jgi:threonine dehydratase
MAEGAGAAATAGAVKLKERLKGKKVSITISGANTTLEQLQGAIRVYQGSS